MKKFLRVLLVIYIVVAVFLTAGLLTHNDKNLSEFGGKTFINAKDDLGNYKKGSLIIVNKSKDYEAGENVFYCKLKKEDCVVSYGKIETMMSGSPSINNETISEKLIIGKDEKATAIPVLGTILGVLESRWGYLCIVVIPILIIFIYENASCLISYTYSN